MSQISAQQKTPDEILKIEIERMGGERAFFENALRPVVEAMIAPYRKDLLGQELRVQLLEALATVAHLAQPSGKEKKGLGDKNQWGCLAAGAVWRSVEDEAERAGEFDHIPKSQAGAGERLARTSINAMEEKQEFVQALSQSGVDWDGAVNIAVSSGLWKTAGEEWDEKQKIDKDDVEKGAKSAVVGGKPKLAAKMDDLLTLAFPRSKKLETTEFTRWRRFAANDRPIEGGAAAKNQPIDALSEKKEWREISANLAVGVREKIWFKDREWRALAQSLLNQKIVDGPNFNVLAIIAMDDASQKYQKWLRETGSGMPDPENGARWADIWSWAAKELIDRALNATATKTENTKLTKNQESAFWLSAAQLAMDVISEPFESASEWIESRRREAQTSPGAVDGASPSATANTEWLSRWKTVPSFASEWVENQKRASKALASFGDAACQFPLWIVKALGRDPSTGLSWPLGVKFDAETALWVLERQENVAQSQAKATRRSVDDFRLPLPADTALSLLRALASEAPGATNATGAPAVAIVESPAAVSESRKAENEGRQSVARWLSERQWPIDAKEGRATLALQGMAEDAGENRDLAQKWVEKSVKLSSREASLMQVISAVCSIAESNGAHVDCVNFWRKNISQTLARAESVELAKLVEDVKKKKTAHENAIEDGVEPSLKSSKKRRL